jgi:hypothetical protein
MLDDMKALVLRSEPINAPDARAMIGTLCRFVADVAPAAGCALVDLVTDTQVAVWNSSKHDQYGTGRSLSVYVGRMRRLLRVMNGLPARIDAPRSRRATQAPLSDAAYEELLEVCADGGGGAWRAFAAGFGAGAPGASAVGAVFETDGLGTVLRLASGERRRVLAEIAAVDGLVGVTVRDGDWAELRRLGDTYISAPVVLQTFRKRVVLQPYALKDLYRWYALSMTQLDAIAAHLPHVNTTDPAVTAMLRG